MTAADLESLIASGGRLVPLPAGTHALDRPMLVTRSDVTIDGSAATLAPADNFDGLVVCPPQLLAPPACWQLDPVTGRQSFRTFGYAGLSFRGTPLDLGPAVLPGVGYYVARGYGNVRRLQVDLWVRRNGPSWTGTFDLAGMQGPESEVPGPWRVQFADQNGQVRFIWREAGGTVRVGGAPIPADNPTELRLTFRLDLDAGTWQAFANDGSASGTFPAGTALDGDQLGHAVVGCSDAGGHVAEGPDLTYLALRVSADRVPLPVGGDYFTPTAATLFLLSMTDPAGPFCPWKSGAAGSGHPSYSGASGFGLAIVRAAAEYRTQGVAVRDLAVTLPGFTSYGLGVHSFPALDLSLRGLRCDGGAAGVGLPFGHTNSYPVLLDGFTGSSSGLTGVWADRCVLRGRDWTVKYARRNAVLMRESSVRLDGLFYAASQDSATEPIEDVCRFDRCGLVELSGASPNFEGSAPRRSYYRLTPSAEFATRAALTFCTAERADGPFGLAAAVRLDGPATDKAARCTLTETPPTYAGPPLAKASGWE